MSAVLSPTPSANGLTVARFGQHVAQRSSLPKWWLDAKQAAYNQFVALPLPRRTDELWRFSNIQGISLDGFEVADPTAGASAPPLPAFARSAEIVFANNFLASRTHLPAELSAKGVIFSPLEEALVKHADLVRSYFQKHPAALGGEKFSSLNHAFASSGAFLFVPKGVEIAAPFVVQHVVNGANKSIFPHTIVILEEQAKATLVEFFASATPQVRQLSAGVNDLHAGPGAQLTYIGTQNWSAEGLAFQSNSITAQKDARVLSLNIHLGGKQARHESHSRLQGPGAHSEMLALSVASGAQEFDQRTLQTHQAPHTSSNLLYKNALLDTARTIFSGLIIVEQDAQKTDAYQSNRNLLLSDNAEANSLPGLEIQANDVRCTHGATSATIPAEQEFYLRSRGIHKAQADELLVFGFFEEVLEKLENEEVHAVLGAQIRAKLKSS